jgi:hypothetical protein
VLFSVIYLFYSIFSLRDPTTNTVMYEHRSYRRPYSEAYQGDTRYHGMIRWLLKDRKLELIQDIKNQNATTVTTFIWDRTNPTLPTLSSSEISKVVDNFVTRYGGSFGSRQWKLCSGYHNRIIDAANSL